EPLLRSRLHGWGVVAAAALPLVAEAAARLPLIVVDGFDEPWDRRRNRVPALVVRERAGLNVIVRTGRDVDKPELPLGDRVHQNVEKRAAHQEIELPAAAAVGRGCVGSPSIERGDRQAAAARTYARPH